MNRVILIGRLTRDPDVRNNTQDNIFARYTLAVYRRYKKDGEQSADFINCVAFGKGAEFAEKYLHQGTKIAVEGRIQTGSYTNRDGNKVYTTDVIVDNQEFAESKADRTGTTQATGATQYTDDDFMSIPDGITDDELPFH